MNLVDSSGWLEYFTSGFNAKKFSPLLNDAGSLIVSTISIYEVFKVILRERGENPALQAIVAMRKGMVADVTSELAIAASKLSLQYGLAMADSLILATAQQYEATIWTQDADFDGLPGVKYFPKA
ncbi:MAG: type II toxin-antitoxin system VapC family toxin [Candidatus Hydrogenedentes bacterium]|nr:type II toxin-antitoxin system VapC family toxin [Candidatus Hydrogenedentota bacterium]